MPSRRHRPLIARALLALALVVAQSGALAHAYSHRLSDLSGTPTQQICGECLGYAPVTAAAGGSQHPVVLPRADIEPIAADASGAIPAHEPFRAFQSRAPPAPL